MDRLAPFGRNRRFQCIVDAADVLKYTDAELPRFIRRIQELLDHGPPRAITKARDRNKEARGHDRLVRDRPR